MARFSFKAAGKELWENTTSIRRGVGLFLTLLLLLIGLIAMITPLLPGRLVIAPAVLILSIYSPSIYRFFIRYLQKYPKVQSLFDRTRNWLIHRLH
jgi:4-hydroxybenzoate polyprenyltransferase